MYALDREFVAEQYSPTLSCLKAESVCVSIVPCFYSAATIAVYIVGLWAGWTEQKQEALCTKPDFKTSNVEMRDKAQSAYCHNFRHATARKFRV